MYVSKFSLLWLFPQCLTSCDPLLKANKNNCLLFTNGEGWQTPVYSHSEMQSIDILTGVSVFARPAISKIYIADCDKMAMPTPEKIWQTGPRFSCGVATHIRLGDMDQKSYLYTFRQNSNTQYLYLSMFYEVGEMFHFKSKPFVRHREYY